MEKPSFFDRLNQWSKRSVTLKLVTVAFLMLLLLIPANLIISLIREREGIRNDAIEEVSSKWGQNQTIAGPVISVPYQSVIKTSDDKTQVINGYVHFLPDELQIDGEIIPEKRYRGIYVVVLYNTILKIKGQFEALSFDALNVAYEDLKLEDALLTLGISDMKGIKEAINVQLNEEALAFGPGTVTKDIMQSGASIPIDLRRYEQGIDFSFSINLNGSSDLYFTPFGKKTKVNLHSTWANPSFEGAFLPDDRTVNNEGFTATWEVLQLNRNYPQQGKGQFINENQGNYNSIDYYKDDYYQGNAFDNLRTSSNAFGVRLLLPIDEYQKTMRSAKYASYFIFITFLTFFFIEVLNKKRLHPIQYLLVGAAIILFYILLLSISEHFNFNWAYLISCGITLALVTFYCSAILKNRKLTAMVFGILAILYGFFYSLLQLQDYALLLGSLGLLLILATIMYLTRHLDWYHLTREED